MLENMTGEQKFWLFIWPSVLLIIGATIATTAIICTSITSGNAVTKQDQCLAAGGQYVLAGDGTSMECQRR